MKRKINHPYIAKWQELKKSHTKDIDDVNNSFKDRYRIMVYYDTIQEPLMIETNIIESPEKELLRIVTNDICNAQQAEKPITCQCTQKDDVYEVYFVNINTHALYYIEKITMNGD